MKLPASFLNPSDRLIAWVVFPAILLIYLLFPTKNYYWDGVFFAQVIEQIGRSHSTLLHPNHLIYNVVGYALYRIARALGMNWRALEVLQTVNSIVSVLAALLLYRILTRLIDSRYLRWCLVLMFAFSATWWKFSTDANAYIPSVFFLLLAFSFLLPPARPRAWLVTLFFVIAVCFHQLAVFCYPVFALGLWWQTQGADRNRRLLTVLLFCVLSPALVLAAYYYSFYLAAGTLDSQRFVQWVTSFSPDASFTFNAINNLGYTLRGHSRLFFNGRFSLLKGLLSSQIVALLGIFFLLVAAWFVLIVRGLKGFQWRTIAGLPRTYQTRLMALWILVYLVFLFFWLPQNTFYRLFYLPAIILLLAELFNYWRNRDSSPPSYRLAVFVAIMALANFLFFIYPFSHAEKYPVLAAALEMKKIWQPNAIVYYGSQNSDNSLIQYFNPETSWRTLLAPKSLEAELRQASLSGQESWLDASAMDLMQKNSESADWLARHAKPETRYEKRDRGANLKFIKIVP